MPGRRGKKPAKRVAPAKHAVRARKRSPRTVARKRKRVASAPNFYAKYTQRVRRRRRTIALVSVGMIVVGLGVLLYPFLPMIRYAIAQPTPILPYESRLNGTAPAEEPESVSADAQPDAAAPEPSSNVNAAPSPTAGRVNPAAVQAPKKGKPRPKPTTNRLVIPKIGVDVEIVLGADQEAALNKGIWHIPGTSFPDRGGNTVLSGHRFRFLSGPRTLYLLDRLKKGDVIIVYWRGKEYDYKVTGSKIVKPKQVEILDNTAKPQLTIFTCSPLFSTKERLVLIAKPI